GQLPYALTEGMDMFSQRKLPLPFFLTVDVAGVGVERHLGIDDEVLALGQVNQHVGTLALAFPRGHADLSPEINPRPQPGALQHIFQNQLAPVALGLLLATQGRAEVVGFPGNLLIQLLEVQQLLRQRRLLLGVLVMDILDLAAKLFDLFTEGLEQSVKGLLAGLGERLPLGLEDATGQLLELQLQLLAALLQQLLLLVEMLLALLQAGLQGGMLHPQLLVPVLQLLQADFQTVLFPPRPVQRLLKQFDPGAQATLAGEPILALELKLVKLPRDVVESLTQS